MNSDKILKAAMYAGEIMLTSGAETWRVEDTMKRILKSYELKNAETFVTTTGIMASVEKSEEEGSGLTAQVKRIKNRTTHLGKIALINNLSRRIVENKISPDLLHDELCKIDAHVPYPTMVRVFAASISCGCFAYMFGGDVWSSLSSVGVGGCSYFLLLYLGRKNVASILTNLICAALLTLLTLIFTNLNFHGFEYMDKVIIGAIMPLVPGIALTNAIRDILEGDFLSGTGRITDALLVAVAIAAGVGSTLSIWVLLFGGYVL